MVFTGIPSYLEFNPPLMYAVEMKVWIKLLIGTILGIILGIILPNDNASITEGMAWLAELAIRIGRYSLVPVLVFTLTIAVYELKQDKQLLKLLLITFGAIIFLSSFVIGLGILVTVIFTPARIPILIDEQAQAISLNTAQNVLDIFPSNMFNALVGDGLYILPLCVFAFFLGMGLTYDRGYSQPVVSIIDSLSRVFYQIVSFFTEILGLVMIILCAYWAVRFSSVLQADIFRDIILLLGIFGGILGLGILPLFLYIFWPGVNPWVVLYGSISQALAAFFSGDINFSLPVLYRQAKDSLGIRRRSNVLTITMFALFGRAGSAMVAASAFIVIIRSYSSLDIPTGEIIAIAGQALALSFLLAGHPGDGAYIAVAVLCQGQSFEAGYLILRPLAFYLVAVGTFLDVMIATVAAFAISRYSGYQEDRDIGQFI